MSDPFCRLSDSLASYGPGRGRVPTATRCGGRTRDYFGLAVAGERPPRDSLHPPLLGAAPQHADLGGSSCRGIVESIPVHIYWQQRCGPSPRMVYSFPWARSWDERVEHQVPTWVHPGNLQFWTTLETYVGVMTYPRLPFHPGRQMENRTPKPLPAGFPDCPGAAGPLAKVDTSARIVLSHYTPLAPSAGDHIAAQGHSW